MTAPDFDVAICGGGPVGSALALLLAERWSAPESLLLIDARSAADAAGDARMIAISHGSRSTLQRLGVWRDGLGTAIHTIHVSHRGAFGRTLIERDDYGVPALGYVVRYGELVQAFDAALTRSRVTVLRPQRASAFETGLDSVGITLADGQLHRAAYAVHAEGGLYGTQAGKAITRDYDQTAITAFVRAALPQPHVAWERFTEHGPIALLPARLDQQNGLALVWCCDPDEAAQLATLDDRAFLDALHRAFGDRLGRFISVSARHAYPLGLNAVATVAEGRSFAIGNAAQTLHPVAGQGLNLGLRDAHCLADALSAHFSAPQLCVEKFLAARRLDRAATVNLTDLLPRIFASRLAPVSTARGAALTLLDLVPPARHWLARQMMNGQR